MDRAARALVIDSSPGCDAAGALLWAATAPEVELVAAIGTWGNVDADQASRNVCKILGEAGSDAPVFRGADGPLGPAPTGLSAQLVYGQDGLGDIGLPDAARGPETEPGADALVRLARERPGEITLVGCAPFTTIAHALALDPALAGRLAGAAFMAGMADGNLTAAAEANVGHDPEAAAAVFDALGAPGALAAGEPARMVPLDVTRVAGLTTAERDVLATSAVPGAATLHAIWSQVWDTGTLETGGLCWPCPDIVTTYTAVHPEVLGWQRLPVAVDTGGSAAWGAVIADRRALLLEKAGYDPDTQAVWEDALGFFPARMHVGTEPDAGAFRAGIRRWLAGDRTPRPGGTMG
jgi:inosine-uridine nucleoside N-ribohydrolase